MSDKMINVSADAFITAMKKLAIQYYKVGMVDIDNDSYVDLTGCITEHDKFTEGQDSFSKLMKVIAESGVIHEEDREDFLNFVSLSNLKKLVNKEAAGESLRYRRIMDGRMRWVSMDIMPQSYNSQAGNKLYIFLRDISMDYLGVIMDKKRNSTGMVYHFKASIDDEVSFKKLVADIAKGIPEDNTREQFVNTYSSANLKKCFAESRRQVDMDSSYIYFGKKVFVHTTVYIVPNEFTHELDCIMNGVDMSENYINERLPRMLYEKEYEMVAVIDVETNSVNIKEYLNVPRGYVASNDYEYYADKISETFIAEEDRKTFKNNTDINNIINELKYSDSYEFSIYHILPSGEKRLKKYTYRNFDMITEKVLVTMEDITELFEKDVLTGGNNRKGFMRNAGKIINESEESEEFAILYYNINNFKAYNEMFELSGGDEILKFMYRVLEMSQLKPELVARLEADHFVCLISEKNLDYDVLVDTCKTLFNYKGKVITLHAKCGVYIVEDKAMEVVGMCDRAKLAKRYIQDEYLKPYEVFSKKMNEQYLDKSEVINNINAAFERGEIKPFFQPVYEAKTGKLASAEALVRWVSPEKGVISPGIFIPALEETGHISQIDAYMETCVRNFLEKRQSKGLPIVPVSINLSWMDLYDEKMMQKIVSEVRNSKLEKGIERFEVTETSYAALSNCGSSILDVLRGMGAKLYLDDFGSGFSSFSTVRDYDFDIIKLDMGFVQKISTSDEKVKSIIQSIIDMAHSVNSSVIAEGAENQAQIDFLVQSGCDYIQGYYYSKPLPQEEFEQLLDNSYL